MSDDAGNGKRTGRPPKDESERRVPLSLRINPDLRSALEAAAKEESRSLTQLSEFALTSFLEARKGGDISRGETPTETLENRPARPARWPRRPIDIFARAFGRGPTALMLMISCLVKGIVYWHRIDETTVQTSWWSDPEIFRELTESITTLLQFIGPDEHLAVIAGVRQALWGPESEKVPEDSLDVASIAMEIALPEYELTEWVGAWGSIIRDWLGHAVVARIRQRLADPSAERKV